MNNSKWIRRNNNSNGKMVNVEGWRKKIAEKQSKSWDPGGLQTTTKQEKDSEENGKQQHKIWNPG